MFTHFKSLAKMQARGEIMKKLLKESLEILRAHKEVATRRPVGGR